MADLTQFDSYLSDDGPAAIVLKQPLMPVEGEEGVFFPATYAAGDGFKGGYNIDSAGGRNIALIDSVGSQANRIEPIFGQDGYKHLVPQIVVTAGEKKVNLLEAGHRAGDAIVRCSSLHGSLQLAFKSVLKGDATQLAKLAPTSLVFGVWDSRDTQAKLPRLISSTIRAYDVHELTRSAVYAPPVNYSEFDVFSEEDKQKAEGDAKNPLSKRGFVNALASKTHGGITANGGIERLTVLGLSAMRLLHAGDDAAKTLALRRYILGLSLVAFTHNPSGYLRQGCILVLNPNKPDEFVEVYPTGVRKPCAITHAAALDFAKEAAQAFGIGESKTVPFDKEKAKADVKGEGDAMTKSKKGKKAAAADGAENA
jgi:CRISPR-associated protein Csb1